MLSRDVSPSAVTVPAFEHLWVSASNKLLAGESAVVLMLGAQPLAGSSAMRGVATFGSETLRQLFLLIERHLLSVASGDHL